MVASLGTAEIARMRSPSSMSVWRPPHVPTRTIRLTPSWISSSTTIAADGAPMPVVCTLIGTPPYVPV